MPKTAARHSGNPVLSLLQGRPLGHPLHSLIVHVPIALFVVSLVLDIASYFGHGSVHLVRGAWFTMCGGEAMGLLAAVPGLADWTSIREDHRSKNIGMWHMGLNIGLLALYGLNIYARWWKLDWMKTDVALCVLSVAGVGILFVSGYLGGMMVYDDGIGVGRHRRRGEFPLRTIPLNAADSPDGFVTVSGAELMENGKTLRLDINGLILALARVNDEYYAFQEFCTHRCGPLSEGSFRNGTVTCPWHGSCFDMANGQVVHGPAKVPIQTYPVQVIDGQVRINLRNVPMMQREAKAAHRAGLSSPMSEYPWKLQESEVERRRTTSSAARGSDVP